MGNFNQGQQGAQFTLLVTNAGGAATGAGAVSVTDTLPTGLTFASGTGTGWSCMANGQIVSCTQANTISGNGSSTLTLNVNVAGNAPASLSNTATVACTCTESNTNNNTSNTDTVTVNSATLTTVNPNTGLQGQMNESVNLTGQFTHWVQGTTTASFGVGITV